jgi:hypothetical protein
MQYTVGKNDKRQIELRRMIFKIYDFFIHPKINFFNRSDGTRMMYFHPCLC